MALNIASPVGSYKRYQEGVAKANAGYTPTIDSTDASVGWTAQDAEGVPSPDQLPGQVFHPAQLPDPDQAIVAGMPAIVVPEYLVTTDNDHPSGPEPWETGTPRPEMAQAVRARALAAEAGQQGSTGGDSAPEAPAGA